ncbi:uncharacterized protein LOC119687420 [Teleopsis dalmanni]|uniref:uncharacterized protein LOC119687420 n=1 Tax=Teleopsis dalmanni TaxID=139649 RepID=UPI000D32980F|nr:uncharacterized protein LOC119687420 [Teleopsis dalmanni]
MNRNMTAKKKFLLILSIFLIVGAVYGQDTDEHEEDFSNSIDEHNIDVSENRLAAQLLAVIEHYKQEDPVGFPGAPIPDPMDVPDMKKSLGMATLNMIKVKAHGLSKFRIQNINADLNAMRVDAGIQLDEMLVKGSYTLSSFFSKASGPFNVILKKVVVKGSATLTVQRDGHLTTESIKMDITFSDMSMDFENLGFLGSVFQGIVNSAPNLVFDAMKPFMLQEADKQLREEINKNIGKLMGDRLLPNSITPLDMAIAEGRKKVRMMGYDPYHLPDYNRTVGIFSMQLSNTWISGIASFYRVGDIIVAMKNNTIILSIRVGTQELIGAGQWQVGCGLVSRVGHVQFSVKHLRVTVNVSQSLDTRKRPQINDLQIELGNIQVRCDGAGSLDYLMEFVVNVLPNLLRYQIMDALENPIKMRLQEKFNTIDVEQAIKDNLHKFENMGDDFNFDFKF